MSQLSAFWVHFFTTFHTESIFVVVNACFVTVLYGTVWKDTAVRLDLGIMTTAVIFPLSFLLQQSFQRRELALNQLSLLRSSITTTAMVTFSSDWPCKGGPNCGGRMQMPAEFNRTAYHNFKALVYLTYAYLSMPTVGYARHRVIPSQRRETKRVHAAQNDILKRVAVKFGDIAMHTEVMKKHGFPATEASRIVNFIATMSDRFELLKVVKYYRTPQATRAFGRVYVIVSRRRAPRRPGRSWASLAVCCSRIAASLSNPPPPMSAASLVYGPVHCVRGGFRRARFLRSAHCVLDDRLPGPHELANQLGGSLHGGRGWVRPHKATL
jgi:hypothetical protein